MKNYSISILLLCVITVGIIVIIAAKYPSSLRKISRSFISLVEKKINDKTAGDDLSNQILPQNSATIRVKLGDLGEKMLETGVIDKGKVDALYTKRDPNKEMDRLLSKNNSDIVVTKENANLLLNFFWALGLGNSNPILSQGPMVQNGDTANFASTGGWTLSTGQAMEHYSKHNFISLNPKQQQLVAEMARNIYRPCCNNPTSFPDCNHGMAMLGFLELAASQGRREKEIYKYALTLNSYWFPNQYLTIGEYLKENGQSWKKVDPKKILGKEYSSSQGYNLVSSKVKNLPSVTGGGACGV